MNRKALWVLFNVGAAILFWYGCVEHVQGAKNVLVFLVWFNLVAALFLLSETVKKTFIEKGRTFPVWLTVPYDIAMTCAFIWVGMWFTGTAYALSSLLQNGIYGSGEEGRKVTE